MSQEGILDVISSHPTIPTLFMANVGSAIPALNELNIFGATAAAGTHPVQTTGSGNTITTNVQISQAIAGTDATKIGLAAFDSASFTVDANGFVSLSGTSTLDFICDVGTAAPVAGNITFNANTNGGASTLFQGIGSSVILKVTDANLNTFVGLQCGVNPAAGGSNTGFGNNIMLNLTNSASGNTCVGRQAGQHITSGSQNSFYGAGAGNSLSTLASNTGIGYSAMSQNTGQKNTVIGASALQANATTGSNNIIIGYLAGNNYNAAETSNLIISNSGTAGESNVIRIGTTGSGASQQNQCFIAGIDGVNVGSTAQVVTELSGQLGTAVITAGTGISVTTGANTITIASNGLTNLTVTSVNHAASPYTVLSTDDFLAVDCSAGVVTIKLPNAPSTGRVFYIKDSTGNAFTNNISVTTVGGAVNIDASATYTMNVNYQAISVVFDGTKYEVF